MFNLGDEWTDKELFTTVGNWVMNKKAGC